MHLFGLGLKLPFQTAIKSPQKHYIKGSNRLSFYSIDYDFAIGFEKLSSSY